MSLPPIPVFFNEIQLDFKPLYEWAFGDKIVHPETTARAESIVAALQSEPAAFEIREPAELPLKALQSIHSPNLITLYNTARLLPEDVTFYPSVFPKSEQVQGDPTNMKHAGCFCFDSGTPLSSQTWAAAAWSAACAKDAAMAVRKRKARIAYALSRPPGHHATRDLFGGYCYFNNAAIAAKDLRPKGRVAILDIDFHHGNGTQRIFYRDPKVLVVSIHGDPVTFYPYFSGHAGETGSGRGKGFNLNLPLQRGVTGDDYMQTLEQHALPAIEHFVAEFLIVSAGLDTYEKDPIGRFKLTTDDFERVGNALGRLRLPTVVIQEGGYYASHLGRNARALLRGVREGSAPPPG